MRVTNGQIYRAQIQEMRRTSEDNYEAQRTAASGRRLERPSDDPRATEQSLLLRETRAGLNQGSEKILHAKNEMAIQEEAIATMTHLIARAQELAVAMASETTTANARIAAATELTEIKGSLLNAANARFGDKRVFSGLQTSTDAFDSAGVYQGDTTVQNITLASGVSVQLTIDGSDVLSGTGSGPDVITDLDNLIAAMTANNTAGIQTGVGQMDLAVDHLTHYRSLVGSRMSMIIKLDEHLTAQSLAHTVEISALEDADAVEAFTELTRTQQAFEAALQVSAASRVENPFNTLLY